MRACPPPPDTTPTSKSSAAGIRPSPPFSTSSAMSASTTTTARNGRNRVSRAACFSTNGPSLSLLRVPLLIHVHRESYPPYGFYILNRVGMEDYIQRLYPEDDITAHSGYVMLRSYPSYTAARLDAIQQKLSSTLPDKFSDIYAYTEAPTTNEKGESQTIGLWTFSTDGSESLQHVLPRHALSSIFLLKGTYDSTDCTPISRKTFPIQNTSATVQTGHRLPIHSTAQPRQLPMVR